MRREDDRGRANASRTGEAKGGGNGGEETIKALGDNEKRRRLSYATTMLNMQHSFPRMRK